MLIQKKRTMFHVQGFDLIQVRSASLPCLRTLSRLDLTSSRGISCM